MKKTHWTFHLHEAGTIKKFGNAILKLESEIEQHEKELKEMRSQIDELDFKAYKIAQSGWTQAEINQARDAARAGDEPAHGGDIVTDDGSGFLRRFLIAKPKS